MQQSGEVAMCPVPPLGFKSKESSNQMGQWRKRPVQPGVVQLPNARMFNQPDHCYFGCTVRQSQLWLFKIASSATHLSFDSSEPQRLLLTRVLSKALPLGIR